MFPSQKHLDSIWLYFFLIKAQVLSSFVCDADFHGQVWISPKPVYHNKGRNAVKGKEGRAMVNCQGREERRQGMGKEGQQKFHKVERTDSKIKRRAEHLHDL